MALAGLAGYGSGASTDDDEPVQQADVPREKPAEESDKLEQPHELALPPRVQPPPAALVAKLARYHDSGRSVTGELRTTRGFRNPGFSAQGCADGCLQSAHTRAVTQAVQLYNLDDSVSGIPPTAWPRPVLELDGKAALAAAQRAAAEEKEKRRKPEFAK